MQFLPRMPELVGGAGGFGNDILLVGGVGGAGDSGDESSMSLSNNGGAEVGADFFAATCSGSSSSS